MSDDDRDDDDARNYTKVAIGGLVAVGLLVGAGLGTRAFLASRHLGAGQEAWGKFERCLVGSAALPGTAAERVRDLELALTEAGGDAAWPGRCTTHLGTVATEMGGAGGDEARRDLANRAKVLVEGGGLAPKYLTGAPPPVDDLFAAARKLGFAASADAAIPEPHAPAAPLGAAAVPALAEVGDTRPRTSVVRGGPASVLWAGGPANAAVSCTEGDGPPLSALKCQRVTGTVGAFAVPLSREPAAPSLFWDGLGAPAVYAPLERKLVATDFSQTSHVFDDGSLLGEARSELAARLLWRDAAGEVRAVIGQLPYDEAWVGQRGPLVFSETERGEPEIRARMIDGAGAVGAIERVAPAKERVVSLRLCRAGESWRALVQRNDGLLAAFRDEGGWKATAPVKIDGSLTAASRAEVDATAVGCAEGSASLAWLTEDGVASVTCTREGCKSHKSAWRPPGSPATIAVLGTKVLVAWTHQRDLPITGKGYDVRMRLAEPAELANVPDVVLVGDETHGGIAKVGEALYAIARADAAAVVIRAGSSLHAIRVDAGGAVKGLTP